MPIYDYKAVSSTGIPQWGSLEAATEQELADRLRARELTVESIRERSLDGDLRHENMRLPRLLQLRIGEELRTAFLTDLPVTDALRALAAEPMQHPARLLNLWLIFFAASTLIILAAVQAVGLQVGYFLLGTAIVLGMLLISQPLMGWWFERRVRTFLHKLAAAVERGQDALSLLAGSAPRDIAAVLNADTSPERRARAAADIVPFLGLRLSSLHRIALLVVLPGVLALSAVAATWALLYFVVPVFRSIFTSFALEIPWYTNAIFWLSRVAEQIGIVGAVVLLVLNVIILAAVYQAVVWSRMPYLFSWLPLIGRGLRHDQLARFAMTLSVLIRSGCEWSRAVRSAAWGLSLPRLGLEAEQVARALETNGRLPGFLPELSLLPITLLLPSSQSGEQDADAVNSRVAEAFEAVARLLSDTSIYEIRLMAAVFHACLVLLSAVGIFVGYFALFGPLIELLRSFV